MRSKSGKAPFLLVAGALAVAATLTRCNSDNGSGPTVQPGISPTAAPTASPSPSLSPSPNAPVQWTGVVETRRCPFPDCPPGFLVRNDGTWAVVATAGGASGASAGGARSGSITADELATLDPLATDVADAILANPGLQCQAFEPLPGQSSILLQIETSDRQVRTVLSIDTDNRQTCWADGLERDKALQEEVDRLIAIYLPSATPSPSVSPSTSPSASPSPSVSPSESPSGSPSPSESPSASPSPSPSVSPSPSPSP